jgi:hypothetical protein
VICYVAGHFESGGAMKTSVIEVHEMLSVLSVEEVERRGHLDDEKG